MLYCPTNTLNYIKSILLKTNKLTEAAPTCFGSRRNHHQGATYAAMTLTMSVPTRAVE